MNYTTNFNLRLPERNEQFNLDDWNNNTTSIDSTMQANKTSISNNATNIASILNGLSTVNTSDTSSIYYKLMKLIYPVGSLYWSSKSTNPASLFGGTWVQIKDRFVLACGDTYTSSGATGGASSVTLSVSNMPSHSHSFIPSGTVSSHNHSFTPSGTISSHNHTFTPSGTVSGFTLGVVARWRDRQDGDLGVSVTQVFSDGDFGGGGGEGGIYDKIVYDPKFNGTKNNTNTVKQTFTGDTASTSMDAPTFTGLSGTTKTSGSGTSFSIMPPYVVKYCFERTA